MTETKIVDDPLDLYRRIPGTGALWPGARFFHVPGTGHTGGVLAILGPNPSISSASVFDPPTPSPHVGRILRLDLTISTHPVSLLALYAPAQPADRDEFFSSTLIPFIPAPSSSLLVCGDFNCVLSGPLDCLYTAGPPPPHNSRLIGSSALNTSLILPLGLHDVWRMANPTSVDFTHFSASARSGARLDRWLASPSFLRLFPSTSSTILPSCGIRTDHLPVSLSFPLPLSTGPPTGRGLSGFPLFLLNMKDAEAELSALLVTRINAFLQGDSTSAVSRWDDLKEEIRLKSWVIYRRHRRDRKQAAIAADSAAATARSDLILTPPPSRPPLLTAWTMATEAAREAWKSLSASTIHAASILDHLFSNTSSYYFHSLASTPKAPTIIKSLHRPNRPTSAPPDTITLSSPGDVGMAFGYARSFFSSDSPTGLFALRHTDPAAQSSLLSSLPRSLSPSHAALAEGLDGDSLLSAKDFDVALSSVRRGSSPGLDGLPYEFYRHFQNIIVPALVYVFNSAFKDTTSPCPLAQLLTGVICLFLKPRQPHQELNSYRPITLLNCDAKLVMHIISNRLNRPLDYVIDIAQSAFLPGRDISDNVRYHLGIAARLRELGLPAWLLDSDLTKAYDTVDRSWLRMVATRLGFSSVGVVRWLEILMAGSESKVRINGFLSTNFPSSNGLPQGSSLSCGAWIIAFEPLLSRLNSLALNGRLLSFPLPPPPLHPPVLLPPSPLLPPTPPCCPPPAPPSTAYADDCRVILLNPDTEGVVSVQQTFALASMAGLPSQSIPKTILSLIHLPPDTPLPNTLNPSLHEHHPLTGYRLTKMDDVCISLGVPSSSDPSNSVDSAYGHMAASMSSSALRWMDLDPCLFGRIHAANQCLASKAVYQMSFHAPDPDRHLIPMQRAVSRLAAATRRAEEEVPFPSHLFPGQHIAFLPRSAGGLGLMDLSAASLAMLSKPIWLLFSYSRHPSRHLLRHEIASSILPSLPPDVPPGAHWIITKPSLAPPNPLPTPSYNSSFEAFRNLGFQRISDPCSQSLPSILLELTFHNSAPGSTSLSISDLSSPMARSWLRLRHVHAAFLLRSTLPTDAVVDLNLILSSLPTAWRSAITSPSPPNIPAWTSVSHPDDPIQLFLGPDHNSPGPGPPPVRLWELWPTGRLHLYDGAFVAPNPADFTPRPALVRLAVWQKRNWLRREYAFSRQQEALPPEEQRKLQEPWLVGIYDDMDLDPTVWGLSFGQHDSVSLLAMEVRHARRRFTHLHSLRRAASPSSRLPGFADHGAIWPALWPLDTSPTAPTSASASDAHLGLLGLTGLEERWRRTAARRTSTLELIGPAMDSGDDPVILNTPPSWLDLQPRPPRPSRTHRMALRGSIPDPDIRTPFPGVWRPLLDPTIHPPFVVTAWRILHGSIGCNAYLSHCRFRQGPWDPALAACSSPGCSASHVAEDITHAFFSCPDVRPVVDWFFDMWHALSGLDVPRIPSILLADDPHLWPDKPTCAALLRHWHFFRITTLGAIWRTRCSRLGFSHQGSFARRAARLVIDSTISAISRDWTRTQRDVRTMDDGHFCTDWWRGFDARIPTSKFISAWAIPATFCDVVGDPPATPLALDSRTLVFRLSPLLVPLPP